MLRRMVKAIPTTQAIPIDPSTSVSVRLRKAAFHDAEAESFEDYLRRTKWHGLTVATALRFQRMINAHRAAAARLRG